MYQDKPPIGELVDELYHYGMPRRSGRYPWGSGDSPYQHSGDFISRVNELKKQGMTESQIAETMGIVNHQGKPSITKLRAQYSIAKDERRSLEYATAKGLREKGYSLNQIAAEMGYKNDSSVRSLLNENSAIRMNEAKNTAEYLKKQVDEKGMIDVGTGVDRTLNISKERMDQALEMLWMEGYEIHGGRTPQVNNPGKLTTLKVLCKPGTPHKDIFQPGAVQSVEDYISRDDGMTFEKKFNYPASMDSSRLKIRYADEAGADGVTGIQKDGVIEIRRGVADLSLGESRYSQVRILVDDTHYIKGMAVYSDDMPDGVDVVFNTNKTNDKPMKDVLKKIKNDPDNPFGSAIKDAAKGGQYWYDPETGKRVSANHPNAKLGLINKRADEGDWSEWKDKVPSQFLSKQSYSLAKRQIDLAVEDKMAEYEDICSLENPTVKKRLLQSFADDCDSAAVHLQAAALPRQKYHVILPINDLKETEIYAPNYNDGEKVALVRYPHGGTFEIPILTVNNKNKVGKNLLGNVEDAVGINSKVAEQLSGADFDGDTVMVIPTNDKIKITSKKPLEDLEGFDPKIQYGTEKVGDDYINAKGQKIKVMNNTQNEMGRISNLITDMTLKGATDKELARAVKHSMVVIDAEKHKLDYKQSEIDNGIASLKRTYQGSYDENGNYRQGASTLISRAKGQYSVDKRQGSPKVNMKGSKDYDPTRPEGALIYKTADDLYYEKKVTNKRTGEVTYKTVKRTEKSTNMAETDDAYSLVSDRDTPMERLYADYANKMKSLANESRKVMMTTGKIEYSASAKKTYQSEVDSLISQLNEAKKNKPRERQAQIIANSIVEGKKQANPDMTKEDIRKENQRALAAARQKVGAQRTTINISDRQWEAIQAGAISENTLKEILNNTDVDVIREKATPRARTTVSEAKANRIMSLNDNGRTNAEIAKMLGLSTSTVSKYLSGKE